MTRPSAVPAPPPPLASDIASALRDLRLAERSRELDRTPVFPWDEFRALGSRRLLGLRTPPAAGGRGLTLREVAAGLHALAYGSGTTFAKLSLQPEFCGVLAAHGSDRLREEYFRPLAEGRLLIGNQITEPGAGSDATALELRARRTGDEYVLDGTKSEAAFAVDAEAAIVYAKAGDDGVSAFLVPQTLPGVERTVDSLDMGERWMRRGTVRYSSVRVPVGSRIGPEGGAFELLKEELTRERLLLAAIYLGVGRSSFDEVVEHVGVRKAFGKPLRAQQAVAFPLADDWARLDATWLYLERALVLLEQGEDVSAEAALAKRMATDDALHAIDHAIQFHGGRGYSSALPHEQRWRDVRSGAIAHGPSEVMLRVAAGRLWPRPGPGA